MDARDAARAVNSTLGDIESALVTVFAQIAEDAREELESLIADLERTLEAKRRLRERLKELDSDVDKADLDALKDTIKSDLDSMGEMGEIESLRLQMAMDRMSKMMSTLSNVLKKMSDTAQAITQNIK